MTTLSIIGCGHVGRALGKLLSQSGFFTLHEVVNRTTPSTTDALRFLGAGKPVSSIGHLSPVSYLMVSVPDQELASVAKELEQSAFMESHPLVFHCSGSYSIACFEKLRAGGARTLGLHPLKSFADPMEVVAHFAGTFCAVEGELPPTDPLYQALVALQARPFTIASEAKTLYHAASVIGCNYLVSLIELALQVTREAGIPEGQAREMLLSAMAPVLRTALTKGPAEALTGPIARGDSELVRRHREALSPINPLLARCYAELGQVALELRQKRSPKLSTATEEALLQVLQDPDRNAAQKLE